MFKLCCDVPYMWWGSQQLYFQEWEDFIKSKYKTILAILMFVPCKNTPGNK